MSKTKNKFFQISAYSAFAGCFLLLKQETSAQVVYHDIDPDKVLDVPGIGWGLDMDENGTIDFAFLNSSFTFYSWNWHSYKHTKDLLAGPYIQLNALAGISHYHPTYSGGFWWYYPYALSYAFKIDFQLPWQTAGQQILALITTNFDNDSYFIAHYADWQNESIVETIDHYLGVRFIDSDSLDHYGWIRCDVLDTGRTLVIKDYAYNSEPHKGLYAGELISATEELSNNIGATVYSFGKNIYLQVNDFTKTNLIVSDLSGKELLKRQMQTENEVIDMKKYPAGIYLVTLTQDEKQFVKKVMIE